MKSFIRESSIIYYFVGIFNNVEYVIMVGVAGSIPGRPNNTVEVGDVVVSQPAMQGGALYVHCTGNYCGRGGRGGKGALGGGRPGRGGRWEGWEVDGREGGRCGCVTASHAWRGSLCALHR